VKESTTHLLAKLVKARKCKSKSYSTGFTMIRCFDGEHDSKLEKYGGRAAVTGESKYQCHIQDTARGVYLRGWFTAKAQACGL